jgi:asparagine synthase (glutamine-hydrolysing)
MVSPDQYESLLAPHKKSLNFNARDYFSEKITDCLSRVGDVSHRRLNASFLFEMETFLQGLLIVEDKASMAHGLEVRMPFLDNSVLDFALTVPADEKIFLSPSVSSVDLNYGRGVSSMPDFSMGKRILRDVLIKYVPEEISNARKQGFSPPVETWYRRGMKDWIESEVFSFNGPVSDCIDIKMAKSILKKHNEEGENYRLFIVGMIAVHLFSKTILEANF